MSSMVVKHWIKDILSLKLTLMGVNTDLVMTVWFSRRDMRQLSRGQQRRRGPRSASSGGPGREGSTRLPAEKVSLTTWTLKEPNTKAIMLINAAQTVTHSTH